MMNCPKCNSSQISSFLKPYSQELIPFNECDDCGFEWNVQHSKQIKDEMGYFKERNDDTMA